MERLYAGYLVVIAESEELTKKLSRWKDGVQGKGVKVNMNKTKFMISRESHKELQNNGRWPCGRGVGRNSVQCTNCRKWLHKKCSGIKGSKIKVSKSFVHRSCTDHPASMVKTSVDVGVGVHV